MDWWVNLYIWGAVFYVIVGLIMLFYGWVEGSDHVKKVACRWLIGSIVWPVALVVWIIRKAELDEWVRSNS